MEDRPSPMVLYRRTRADPTVAITFFIIAAGSGVEKLPGNTLHAGKIQEKNVQDALYGPDGNLCSRMSVA